MRSILASIFNQIREKEYLFYKIRRRWRLRNKDVTIISSNCSGAFMYYDLGMQYRTPTVNLSIEMKDFVKMAGNLKWYMEQEPVESEEKVPCPVGLLGDIKIYFIHYDSFDQGRRKWEERKKRINWENIFIVGSEKDGCTYETIKNFEELPFENKVIFTRIEYPEFPSACCIKGFEDQKELGVITYFKKQVLKRRYLDDFDYVSFLNKMKKDRA